MIPPCYCMKEFYHNVKKFSIKADKEHMNKVFLQRTNTRKRKESDKREDFQSGI